MRKIIFLVCLLTTCFTVKAQLFTPGLDEGYYYDNTGAKISGFIRAGENQFFFKKYKKDVSEKKIAAGDIKGYVMGKDSFTVSRNPVFKKPPFLKVLINNSTKLYFFKADEKISFEPVSATSTGFAAGTGKGRSKYYFYGADPDALQLITETNFIAAMSELMGDKPEIIERVKDKTITLKNLEEWVLFYNQEKAAYPTGAPANK
ncbi:MAG: hypothetical protein ABIN95_09270 [Mucilaginibacter sp.]